jgi:hypothetical protein
LKLNPNPNYFKAIIKLKASAEKSHYYTNPCTALREQRRGGDAFSAELKIAL